MTRNLTLVKGLAVAGISGLLLTGCGSDDPQLPGGTGDGDSTSSTDESSGSGSYSVMLEWDGCEALGDIQPVQDYMGVTDLGSTGELITSTIGAGLDGEAFTCAANATLPAYNHNGKELPGDATITVGGVPWDSEEEATENFQTRVAQLMDSIENGGLDYMDPQEGEFEGDWDESFYYAADTSTGYTVNAIGRKGDLIVYTFISHLNDPGVEVADEQVYPFTDEELVDWVLNDYMPTTHADLLAKKESGL